MSDGSARWQSIEALVPHLDAAYNLARWLTRNHHDAQDVVQDAFVRAIRFADARTNSDPRAWLLAIVRNACFSWLRRNRPQVRVTELTDDLVDDDAMPPEVLVERLRLTRTVNEALAALPVHLREVLVLRELEDLSYKDIALIVNRPVGTVMSRLARGRQLLRESPLVRGLVLASLPEDDGA